MWLHGVDPGLDTLGGGWMSGQRSDASCAWEDIRLGWTLGFCEKRCTDGTRMLRERYTWVYVCVRVLVCACVYARAGQAWVPLYLQDKTLKFYF